ncbi:hypothetical protein GN244_ATG15534 [Phytophthora infestans]|uniref:Uncharacterized protein n=1 Tax=Phytophthora infestans TaxID=4787 RepID=A0A833W8B3_PHYIN|nr:hypothetical protein GN244_ATG15534 [Phytophthora infestans]
MSDGKLVLCDSCIQLRRSRWSRSIITVRWLRSLLQQKMQMLSKTQIVCPRLVGDDSDFHDALHEKEVDDVKEAEEGNSDENDVDGISEKEEDEGSDENEEARDSKFGVVPKYTNRFQITETYVFVYVSGL